MFAAAVLSAALTCLPNGSSEDRGVHQRLSTENGPIHLWCRDGAAPTETVIFVHGHELDADTIYARHSLADQFYSSGRNALFIVPEAPLTGADPLRWASVESLLSAVDTGAGLKAPRSLIVTGHSGAFRTIASWLSSPLVARVALLDGFYGDMLQYDDWLTRRDAQLTVVSAVTAPRADAFIAALDEPRRLRVLHQKSTLGHWELISAATTLPRVIADQPRETAPVGRDGTTPASENPAAPAGTKVAETPRS